MSSVSSVQRAQANLAVIEQEEKVKLLSSKIDCLKATFLVAHQQWEALKAENAKLEKMNANYDRRMANEDTIRTLVLKKITPLVDEISLAESALRIEQGRLEVIRAQSQQYK